MNEQDLASLEGLEGVLKGESNNLPPVQNWHPERAGQIDICIRRDASWWHEGREITRLELVRLFSGVLRVESGEFWLVTPVEKLKIQVDDAPFLVTSLEILNDANSHQLLVFCTNVGDKVLLGENNQLYVDIDQNTGEPSPYVHVRHGLNALISRSVYYELVELGKQDLSQLFVSSAGMRFSLGSIIDV